MTTLANDDDGARLVRNDGLMRWFVSSSSSDGLVVRKVLDPEQARRGELARRWLECAAKNASLRAESCSELLSTGQDACGTWVVSRYHPGPSLSQLIRSGSSVAVALHTASLLLLALEAAQENELTHLDLDPAGVTVCADGSLVLPEFGLWGALAPAELARARFDARRVSYLAPELVQARGADPRADLHAVGWLLYEALSGRAPFSGATPLDLAMAIDRGACSPLSPARSLPPGLSDVVEMLLQPDPRERFESALAARSALASVASFDATAARRELAALARAHATQAVEARTRIGLGALQPAPAAARLRPEPGLPQRVPSVGSQERRDSLRARPVGLAASEPGAGVAPPPLLLSAITRAPSSAPGRREPSLLRAPRAEAPRQEPVHDGRTAFLRVRSALRSVLPHAREAAPRTVGPRAVHGKWQDPSSTLFRVRRAALSGPIVRVAAWPRAWSAAVALGLGTPLLACAYLLCRLWF